MSNDLDTARALLDAGRADAAADAARRVLATDPGSVPAHEVLITALVEGRHFVDALRATQPALAVAPDHPQLHHLSGISLYQLRRYQQAEEALRRALELEPEYSAAHAVLAKALAHRKDRSAMTHAARAIQLDPEWSFAHRSAGDVAIEFKDWPLAETHYRRALALHPEDSLSHTNLGFVLAQQGRSDEALDASVNAARLDPTNEIATGNVVRMGRGAVAGAGIAFYVLFQLVGRLPRQFGPAGVAISVIGVAGLLGYWAWRRRQRFAQLPPTVQAALTAQRRREGPGSVWLWLVVAEFGLIAAGVSLAGAIDAQPVEASAAVVVTVALAAVAVAAVMLRRKLPHYDARTDVTGPFAVWAALVVVLLGVALLGLRQLGGLTAGSRGDGLGLLVLVALPLAGALYVAWHKRPGRD